MKTKNDAKLPQHGGERLGSVSGHKSDMGLKQHGGEQKSKGQDASLKQHGGEQC